MKPRRCRKCGLRLNTVEVAPSTYRAVHPGGTKCSVKTSSRDPLNQKALSKRRIIGLLKSSIPKNPPVIKKLLEKLKVANGVPDFMMEEINLFI